MSIKSSPEQTEPETERAEQPVGRLRGFLQRLHLVRVSSHEEGDKEVSSPSGAAVEAGGNGNVSNSDEASENERSLREPSRTVEEIVNDAIEERQHLIEQRDGPMAARIAPPFEAGPQRYTDPSIWGPNYRLRGASPNGENTPRQIAAMEKVPLPQDQRLLKILELLSKIEKH